MFRVVSIGIIVGALGLVGSGCSEGIGGADSRCRFGAEASRLQPLRVIETSAATGFRDVAAMRAAVD